MPIVLGIAALAAVVILAVRAAASRSSSSAAVADDPRVAGAALDEVVAARGVMARLRAADPDAWATALRTHQVLAADLGEIRARGDSPAALADWTLRARRWRQALYAARPDVFRPAVLGW